MQYSYTYTTHAAGTPASPAPGHGHLPKHNAAHFTSEGMLDGQDRPGSGPPVKSRLLDEHGQPEVLHEVPDEDGLVIYFCASDGEKIPIEIAHDCTVSELRVRI
jgi:hypothetical protein